MFYFFDSVGRHPERHVPSTAAAIEPREEGAVHGQSYGGILFTQCIERMQPLSSRHCTCIQIIS